MKPINRLGLVAVLAVLAACSSGVKPQTSGQDGLASLEVSGVDGSTRLIQSTGTASMRSSGAGVEGLQYPELFPGSIGNEGSLSPDLRSSLKARTGLSPVNRSYSQRGGVVGASVQGVQVGGVQISSDRSNPVLQNSFLGLNLRDQRLANNGNQFTVEPPDQALCVGNGYILESVNDVLRVFNTDGSPATGVIDQNTFYGYPAAIRRDLPAGSPNRFGPEITDPICYYDPDTKRFYHVVLTLFVDPASGNFTGKNSLDIAVSQTSDPTGNWMIYHLPVQNDGTDGTPNHGCSLNPDGTGNGPCLGDYPHIGADANGIFLTTNEYSFLGAGEFKSANIYAISKRALAAGTPSISVVEFRTENTVNGKPGFTVWPAISPKDKWSESYGGTEYFLSTNAADEANTPGGLTQGPRVSDQLVVWAIANTGSLNSRNPRLRLFNSIQPVNPYGVPPLVNQKDGPAPLKDCINDTTVVTPFGTGCWNLLFTQEPKHNEQLSKLDPLDSRMQQVYYSDGKLYGGHGTALNVGGSEKAGISWYILEPNFGRRGLTPQVIRQGYLAVLNNNVIDPAIAITKEGKGIMAFTLVGQDHYPSAAFASIGDEVGVGAVQVAAEGVGPQDGFSGYNAFAGSGVARPRWGDYGAAVADGNIIYIASEYIAQSCTLSQYLTSPIGSCGATRTALANWATRVSSVKP
ncbi:MAG: hypothetical protein IVW51_08790 [Thermaceae bacterium]|nr:hypothetical protein [Thermaceae bacterium]